MAAAVEGDRVVSTLVETVQVEVIVAEWPERQLPAQVYTRLNDIACAAHSLEV